MPRWKSALEIFAICGCVGLIDLSIRSALTGLAANTSAEAALVVLCTFVVYGTLLGAVAIVAWLLALRFDLAGAASAFGLGVATAYWLLYFWHLVAHGGDSWTSPRGLAGTATSLLIATLVALALRSSSSRLLTLALFLVAALPSLWFVARSGYRPKDFDSSASVQARGWTFVLLVDTFAATHSQLYGYERDVTPELERFAQDAVLFEHAIAPSSWTRPSVASLFTSLHVRSHHLEAEGVLPTESDVLAARFSEAGYPTAGFSTNRLVSEASAFDRGFSYFTSRLAQRSATRLVTERPLPKLLMGKLPVGLRWSIDRGDDSAAARVNQQVLDWLDTTSLRAGGLVYIHYFDPHSPYTPPPEFAVFGSEPSDLYDGELRYWDAEFGRLLGGLRHRGIYDDATIVVLSDHGEEFGEHGGASHGHTLYEELVHVPLLVKTPSWPAQRIAQTVSLLDVTPTLLELADAEPLRTAEGRSLGALVAGESTSDDLVVSELFRHRRRHRVALYDKKWKLILHPRSGAAELYDLQADPGETVNVLEEDYDRAWLMLDRYVRRSGSLVVPEKIDREGSGTGNPEELMEALKALGYAG